jgi:hypothetical protein
MKSARKWYRTAKKEETLGGRSFRQFARHMFAPLSSDGKLLKIVSAR